MTFSLNSLSRKVSLQAKKLILPVKMTLEPDSLRAASKMQNRLRERRFLAV